MHTRDIDMQELAERAAVLSMHDRISLLTGLDFWSLRAKPEIGLRRVVFSDGPAGVRGEHWDERETSANSPCPAALGATWDEELVASIGRVLAWEARRKGVDALLAPTLNLQRSPFGGRDFECFSEDPLLTGALGAAFIRGLQGAGVAATAKHFIANEAETERHTVDVEVDERTLHEVYLAPFEAAVRAGVWAVMASYNSVNGTSMTESEMLRRILRDELGFDGVIVSDWFATRTTVESARAGLDVVMPGPDGPWGEALVDALDDGAVPESAIGEKVEHVLRMAARVGALDASDRSAHALDTGEVAATLRRAAGASLVLATNREDLLPLDPGAIRRLAVIGPNATTIATGGGSAKVFAPYEVTPLDGLRAALARRATVDHAPGPCVSDRIPVAQGPWIRTPAGLPGAEVRFVARDGRVLASEHRLQCAFNWPRSLEVGGPLAWVEVHVIVRAIEDGTYAVGASGLGHFRLTIGGALACEDHLQPPPGMDPIIALTAPPQMRHEIRLARGEQIDVVLAHEVGTAATELGDIGLAFQLNLGTPHGTPEEELAWAEALAGAADAAVVIVGTSAEFESEGVDRSGLALPGPQDELVRRVAAANARTVVVVNSGAPVLLPWVDKVGAVILACFPGQEFGNALADVLLGAVEPSGRLPVTWPLGEENLPSCRPVEGRLRYDERLRLGYRATDGTGSRVRFPFGHGLGYSRWTFEALAVPERVPAGSGFDLEVTLRNVGPRASRELVQVYASRPDSVLERPARWLVAFGHVAADPGAQVSTRLRVPARALEHWDADASGWRCEPGRVVLRAGSSADLLPLEGAVTIAPSGAEAGASLGSAA